MEEVSNILRILRETEQAVKEENTVLLKELSNQTVHTASIQQDADNIMVAVIVYSLSKIIERKQYQEYKNWPKFFNKFLLCVKKAREGLEKNNIEEFREQVKCIREEINSLSGNLKSNIQDVFRKASINKASKIYEHGISMEQTAKLLGITIWDLAEYAGQSGIGDVNLNISMPVKKRIKNAMEIFEK